MVVVTILFSIVYYREVERHLPDYTVSSLTELLGDIITLINDEVLVEDLEDLTALEICHIVAATFFAGPRDDRSKVFLRLDI